jgi:hypothetical protein
MLTRSPFQRLDYRRNLQLAMTHPGAEVVLLQDAVLALRKAPEDYQKMVEQRAGRGSIFTPWPRTWKRGVWTQEMSTGDHSYRL